MRLQNPYSIDAPIGSFVAPNIASFHRWTRRCLEDNNARYCSSSKFTRSLSVQFNKPSFLSFINNHNYWSFQDKAIFEAVPFSLSDLPDSSKWFILLSFVYVYDAYRSQNIGSELIKILTSTSEDTSCAIGLVACPFSFSKDGFRAYSVGTADDVWRLREMATSPCSNLLVNIDLQDRLIQFYRRHGFRNMCLHHHGGELKPRWAGIPFENHLVYLPQCLSAERTNHLNQRLEKRNCCFCSQKYSLI